jgi:hypothetical protein
MWRRSGDRIGFVPSNNRLDLTSLTPPQATRIVRETPTFQSAHSTMKLASTCQKTALIGFVFGLDGICKTRTRGRDRQISKRRLFGFDINEWIHSDVPNCVSYFSVAVRLENNANLEKHGECDQTLKILGRRRVS